MKAVKKILFLFFVLCLCLPTYEAMEKSQSDIHRIPLDLMRTHVSSYLKIKDLICLAKNLTKAVVNEGKLCAAFS